MESDEWREIVLGESFDPDLRLAPHITEELWHEMGHDDTVHVGHWPVDENI